MARPKVLTDKQIEDIKRKRLDGESVRGLARDYKVGPATISRIVSKRTETVKSIANQLARAELEFERLPVSEQVTIRNLADQLKGISTDLAVAAKSGSNTARQLNRIAEKRCALITQRAELNESAGIIETMSPDDYTELKTVVAFSQAANEASKIPLNLLSANKKMIEDLNEAPRSTVPEGLGFLYGE